MWKIGFRPMSIGPRLPLVLLMVLPLAAGHSAEATDLSVTLGFADGRPAVFLSLRQGMKVELANIVYDESDQTTGYDLEARLPSGEKLAIKLRPGTDRDSPDYRYEAEINGKAGMGPSSREWEAENIMDHRIAFFPEGMGGYVLRFPGSSVTQSNVSSTFSYDSEGRRSFGAQSFTCDGTTYSFEYSDHQRDDSGRLIGYTAEVLTLSKEIS